MYLHSREYINVYHSTEVAHGYLVYLNFTDFGTVLSLCLFFKCIVLD